MSSSHNVVAAEDAPGTMIKRVFHVAKILAVVTNVHEMERESPENRVKNRDALDLRYREEDVTIPTA
ncbi:MAG: hypothetical protein IAE80_29245 [Anaerolinea sp.]|nr:hypothetical protein [Anaerolinea sp.]